MTEPTVCALHLDGGTTEHLKPFDDVSWTKVVDIQKKRRCMFASSKYFAISLPETCDSSMGYHSKCYKNFTAIHTHPGETSTTSQPNEPSKLLRSNVIHPDTSSTGIFEHRCVFCEKVRKKISRDQPEELLTTLEYDRGENSIQVAAKALNDDSLLAKIGGLDLIAKELKFHHSCRRSYIRRANNLQDDQSSNEPSHHQRAIEGVKSHVQRTLIDIQGAEKLTTLFERYTDLLGTDETPYTAQKLCEKLLKEFPDVLKTCKRSNKDGVVLFNYMLDSDNAYRRANFDVHSVKEAAFYLRKQILSSPTTEMPTPLNVESIHTGQANKPEDLLEFFKVLYTGSSGKVTHTQTERLIDSVTDDVIYATSHGRIQPGKHLSLALAMKSLTGSRRVIEILNRLGHSTGYHVAETIETQFATEISARSRATPDGMSNDPHLCTSLAWDNYDENTETLSGKGTLHDTVGICYQNLTEDDLGNDRQTEIPKDAQPTVTPAKSKVSLRSFKMEKQQLEPY